MINKHTNDGGQKSPNPFSFWNKVFGFFMLLLVCNFQAQISVTEGEDINKDRFQDNEKISDTLQFSAKKIYIDSYIEFYGLQNLSANYEIVSIENVEDQIRQTEKNQTAKAIPAVIVEYAKTTKTYLQKKPESVDQIQNYKQENKIFSTTKTFKSFTYIPVYQKINKISAYKELFSKLFGNVEVVLDYHYPRFSTFLYCSNLSVGPPPFYLS